jgi:hypothetical protein
MWFGTRRAPDGGYGCLLPGYARDKEEFYRAEKPFETENVFNINKYSYCKLKIICQKKENFLKIILMHKHVV